jgi:hypothetical protein
VLKQAQYATLTASTERVIDLADIGLANWPGRITVLQRGPTLAEVAVAIEVVFPQGETFTALAAAPTANAYLLLNVLGDKLVIEAPPYQPGTDLKVHLWSSAAVSVGVVAE